MKEIAGHLDASGLRFGIVLARFNSRVTEVLLSGALDGLRRHGAADEQIVVVRVPGAFEMPHALRRLARHEPVPDAMIALGALVRGDTPHFEFLAREATRMIAAVDGETGIPVANGLLTCDAMDQALDRAGGKAGNKGFEAAMTAIEMANLARALSR
ncbi:MAG: 6,7-dimethyl-8-ribityllumazine synthase [Acidobacteriota bacterium]|nr:MAG: 6,7-dimethyl-8-ribityllumazine synthase [Acidobacteriota bacterium]